MSHSILEIRGKLLGGRGRYSAPGLLSCRQDVRFRGRSTDPGHPETENRISRIECDTQETARPTPRVHPGWGGRFAGSSRFTLDQRGTTVTRIHPEGSIGVAAVIATGAFARGVSGKSSGRPAS